MKKLAAVADLGAKLTKYSNLSNKRGVSLITFQDFALPCQKFLPPRLFISQIFSLSCFILITLLCTSTPYTFSKKSHPPRLFTPPRLLIQNFCIHCSFIPISSAIREMRVASHQESLKPEISQQETSLQITKKGVTFRTLFLCESNLTKFTITSI